MMKMKEHFNTQKGSHNWHEQFVAYLWHVAIEIDIWNYHLFSEPYFESMNEDYIRFSIIFCDDHLHYDFIKVAYAHFCLLITDRFE